MWTEYSHLFKNSPQFVEIHTVKTLSIVNEADVDVFREFSCFIYNPTDVGNLASGSDCSHEIKRCLLLGRKVMTNLDSIFKSRDITLPAKVCLVKAMVFPVVMHGMDVRVGL